MCWFLIHIIVIIFASAAISVFQGVQDQPAIYKTRSLSLFQIVIGRICCQHVTIGAFCIVGESGSPLDAASVSHTQ